MSALNITDIPEAFAELFGLSYEASGIILSVGITIVFIIAVALLVENLSLMPVAIVGISFFAVFTFIGWFPLEIMIVIALAIAILYARETTKATKGG